MFTGTCIDYIFKEICISHNISLRMDLKTSSSNCLLYIIGVEKHTVVIFQKQVLESK